MLILSLVLLAQTVDPPAPPPANVPNQAVQPAGDEGGDGPELLRYQACFQKMVDVGASDNAFMKKCLGIPDTAAKKPALTAHEAAEALRTANGDLLGCYKTLIAAWKDLGKKPTGELAFALRVAGGAPADVSYLSGMTDAALVGCFRTRLKAVKFKKTDGPEAHVDARWTLKFLDKAGRNPAVVLPDGAVAVKGPGGVASEDALAVFKQNAAKIHRCYDDLLKRAPTAAGTAALSLLVSAHGKVTKVGFRDLTVGDEAFAGCMTKELKTWRFPPPASGASVKVDYPPLEFRPRQ